MRSSSKAVENGLIVSVTDRCADVADSWRQLETSGAATPFQTYSFVSTLLETVGVEQGAVPRIVVVSDDAGTPQMILPLVLFHLNGARVLTSPDFKVVDYFAPVMAKSFAEQLTPARFAELWRTIQAIVGDSDVVDFPKMPAMVEGVPNPLLHLGTKVHETAFLADFAGGLEAYESQLSKSFLSSLKRKERMLGRQGKVAFSTASSTVQAIEIAQTMINFKSKRYRSTGVRDLFDEPAYRDFYEKLAEREWGNLVHLSSLSFEDEPMAVSLSVSRGGVLFLVMPAFDLDRFQKGSVGLQYIHSLCGWACANHYQSLDFTWGDEAYKFSWVNRSVPLHRCRYPVTARGRLHCGSANAVEWTRGALKTAISANPVLLSGAKMLRKRLNGVTSPFNGRALSSRSEP
ncbi:GNAT family N-acetyltransferase [Aurantimonas sp. DM33-3]|uniref:GNAT family N-acetyltransferase n=1 Tax=Aurantimonas sp. DM33-3 TaxID=2766955 RepID=UPI001651CF49|nr:GNAT family N-acetyltransferase [Aurantimonas sp. DM33-3]MBC6715561.1 GNAT family N-acetyltransferase [Aurantimonas sp. DM33-3]